MTEAGDPETWTSETVLSDVIERLPNFRGWLQPRGDLMADTDPDRPTHTTEPACSRCGDLRDNHEGDEGELECSICRCPGGTYSGIPTRAEDTDSSIRAAIRGRVTGATLYTREDEPVPISPALVTAAEFYTHEQEGELLDRERTREILQTRGPSGATYEGGLYTGPWGPPPHKGGPVPWWVDEGAPNPEGGQIEGASTQGGLDEGPTHQGRGQEYTHRDEAQHLATHTVEQYFQTPWSTVPYHLQQALIRTLHRIALHVVALPPTTSSTTHQHHAPADRTVDIVDSRIVRTITPQGETVSDE